MSFENKGEKKENNKNSFLKEAMKNIFGNYFSEKLYKISGDEKDENFYKKIPNNLSGNVFLYAIKSLMDEYDFGTGESFTDSVIKTTQKNNEINSLVAKRLSASAKKRLHENTFNVVFDDFIKTEEGLRLKKEIKDFTKNEIENLILKYVREEKIKKIPKIEDISEYVMKNLEEFNIDNEEKFLEDYAVSLENIKNFTNEKIGENLDSVRWKEKDDESFKFIKSLFPYFNALNVSRNQNDITSDIKEKSHKERDGLSKRYIENTEETFDEVQKLQDKLLREIEDIKAKEEYYIKNNFDKVPHSFKISILFEKLYQDISLLEKNNEEINEEIFDKIFEISALEKEKKDEILKIFNEMKEGKYFEIDKKLLLKTIEIYFLEKINISEINEGLEKKKEERERRFKKNEEIRRIKYEINKKIASLEAKSEFDKAKILHELEVDINKLNAMQSNRFKGELIESDRELGQWW